MAINGYHELSKSELIERINANLTAIKLLEKKVSNKEITEESIAEKYVVNNIMDFLETSNPSQLFNFLSPENVDKNADEQQLVCFKLVAEKIKTFEAKQKEIVINSFKKFYPKILQRILDDVTNQMIALEKNKPDVYRESLNKLMQDVVGQNKAAAFLASSLASKNADEKFGNKVYLFVGPTGVGKTELAKAVSKVKGMLITLPMNQYMDEFDYSKFHGSGSGLVGSTDKPFFAKKLDETKPIVMYKKEDKESYVVTNSVILFDEIEKAHEKIKQSLLTLFDEWTYTAGYYHDLRRKNVSLEYKFQKCIFINTSNLYQNEILDAFNNKKEIEEIQGIFKSLNSKYPIRNSFSQELLGRMCIIPFNAIPKGDCYQSLIRKKLHAFIVNLKREFDFREFVLENEKSILVHLENKLYGNGTNIRELDRYFSVQAMEIFHRNKSEWGKLSNVKVIFFLDQNILSIKAELLIEDFGLYNRVGKSIKLP